MSCFENYDNIGGSVEQRCSRIFPPSDVDFGASFIFYCVIIFEFSLYFTLCDIYFVQLTILFCLAIYNYHQQLILPKPIAASVTQSNTVPIQEINKWRINGLNFPLRERGGQEWRRRVNLNSGKHSHGPDRRSCQSS